MILSAYTYAAFEFGAYQIKANGKTIGGALQTGTLLSFHCKTQGVLVMMKMNCSKECNFSILSECAN